MKLNGRLAAFVAVLAVGPVVVGQQRDAVQNAPTTQASPGGQASRGGSGRGGRDSVQQAQLKRLKDLLGSTEEEWKVLEPRLEKVQDLLRDSGARSALGSGRGRRGGFGGALPSDTPPTPVQQAAKELQESLASKETSPDDLKSKLAALREARVKSQAELKRAQEQVRELLTARQEAVLVMTGMLN